MKINTTDVLDVASAKLECSQGLLLLALERLADLSEDFSNNSNRAIQFWGIMTALKSQIGATRAQVNKVNKSIWRSRHD